MSAKFLLLLSLLPSLYANAGSVNRVGDTCRVSASTDASDDAPAILEAFALCGNGGSILLNDPLYHIESIMQTTELVDAYVELTGTMLWGEDLEYWRSTKLELEYLNMTTAWKIGGSNVTFDGKGVGTLDGNGQLWYDLTKGVSNLPGRPISLVIANTTSSHFTGLRFVQSQFWTMALTHTQDVLLDNIYVNSTSSNSNPARNTDGVDTFFSDRVTFRNWTVVGGDDNISLKANSTNIHIHDCVFHDGLGVAIGSIGQYPGQFERIENVTAERIVAYESRYAGYIKTWTGIQQNYPPNGGGGGLGYATNITFKDFEIHNLTEYPARITQCTSFSGATGGCDTSLFQISNITWGPFTGSVASGRLTRLQCSGAAPCTGLTFVDFDKIVTTGDRAVTCTNVVQPEGIDC